MEGLWQVWRAAGWFGEELRDQRRRAGLTQQQLSRRAGVSVRAVRDIELGRVRRPRPESVRRLAEAVGLQPAGAATVDGGTPPAIGAQPADVTPAGAQRLTVEVLGPLTVHRGARLVVGQLMQRSLLGLLAVQPNQVVGLEEIVDTLWGEHPPRSCRSLVRGHVARLRKLLELARAQGAASQGLRAAASGGYVLTLGDGELDVLRFDGLVAAAREAQADNPGLAMELLGRALGCWRGAVLADLAPRLREHPAAVAAAQRRVTAALAFSDLAMGQGEHRPAAERLRGLTTQEPLHEGLHARLMLALAGDGQQAAALELFARLRDRLVTELGVEPGAELQEAQARVLQGDLPGIGPSERGAAAAAGAPGGPRPRPAQLPADVAGFTGRASQVEQLDALLRARTAGGDGGGGEGTAVVLTAIAGTAGVGKTALAVHWAHRVAGNFDGGQLYVNLQGYASDGSPVQPLQALAGLLRALGVAPEAIPADLAQAAGLYRSLLAGKRVLVVLDNARSAEQVRPLLPGSPECLVVVTSRDRLTGLVATHGAHRLTMDVLATEEAVALLGRMLGEQRVAAEPEAARDLAEVCGWLPLALRIAAANLTGQPEQSIAGYLAELRVGDRLEGLAVTGDAQAAVHVAFDASYRQLSPDARRVFRLLGLAPGQQVNVPGAAALAELTPERAGQLLNELVDAHLVEPRGVSRVSLHDLLRRYARERAQQEDGPDECAAALGRLLEWYLHATDVAAGLLYPEFVRLPVPPAVHKPSPVEFTDPSGAAAWLEAERANLVAAVQHAAEHGPHPAAWQLADALRGYFWLLRPIVEWLLVARAGLAAATAAGDERAQAAGHLNLGYAAQAAGRSQQAMQHFTTALELARRAGWTNGQAAALGSQGTRAWWSGDLRQAADQHSQALALYRHSGSLGGQGTCQFYLGRVKRDLGRVHEAAQHLTQALGFARRIGSRHGEAHILGALGEIDHDLGRLERARNQLTAALRLHRELGSRFGQALFLRSLAAVDRDAGHGQEALATAQAAQRLAAEIADRSVEARTCNTLASIHLHLGHHQQALDTFQQALDLARATANRAPEASALLGLAAVSQHTGQALQASENAQQALTAASQAGFRLLEGHAQVVLATTHHALGRHAQALGHARQALERFRHAGHRLGQARTLHVLGAALRDTGDLQTAVRCWREALELFTDIGSPEADQTRKLLASPPWGIPHVASAPFLRSGR